MDHGRHHNFLGRLELRNNFLAASNTEIDNIKIEHGNGTKYANQKMGESIKDNCANEFCRFTTLVHNTLIHFRY